MTRRPRVYLPVCLSVCGSVRASASVPFVLASLSALVASTCRPISGSLGASRSVVHLCSLRARMSSAPLWLLLAPAPPSVSVRRCCYARETDLSPLRVRWFVLLLRLTV